MRAYYVIAAMLLAGSARATLPLLRDDQAVSPVVYGPSRSNGPVRAATDGLNLAIVSSPRNTVFATRVSSAGEHLDAPSIVIDRDTGVFDPRTGGIEGHGAVDVVFADGQYVIAYDTAKGVATARLSPSGRLLDAPRIVS